MDPTGGVVQVLAADSVERETLSPCRGLRTRVDVLDEGREHASVSVGRSCGEQDRVGVPGDTGDGGANGLLDVLGDPPVVLLFKVADGDQTSTRAHSELGLGGCPADTGSSAVDAEEHQCGLPSLRRRLPNVGIAIYPCISCLLQPTR